MENIMKASKTVKKHFTSRNRFTVIPIMLISVFSGIFSLSAETADLPTAFFPYGVLHSVKDNFILTKDWKVNFSRQANTWGQSNTNTVCLYGIGAPPNVLNLLPYLGKYNIKVWGSLYMPMAYKPRHPDIVRKTAELLEKYKDDDRIYAFAIKDEPKKEHYTLYAESVEFIKKHDPNHKIVSIFCHNKNVVPYLSLMDTVSIDIYPIRERVRDPWWIEDQCKDMFKLIGGTNKKLIVMPPAHTFYSKDYVGKTDKFIKDIDSPTVEEFRLMSWLSLANGADGVVYFLYKWPSAWIKEREKAIGRGFVNMIGVPSPIWNEYVDTGWKMRPMGQFIAGSRNIPAKGITIRDQKYFDLPRSNFAKINYPRNKREVISVYCRQHNGRPEKYYFVVNNDIHTPRKVNLKIDQKETGSLLNLETLEGLKVDSNGNVDLSLRPGDALVLMAAPDKLRQQAKKLIINERINMRKTSIQAKIMELKQAGVINNPSKYTNLLDNIVDKSAPNTLIELNDISNKLKQTAAADQVYSRNVQLLSQAGTLWTRADNILEKRTISIRTGKTDRLSPICNDMLKYAREYNTIRAYLLGWKNTKNKAEYTKKLISLISKLKKLNSELDVQIANIPEDAKC